MTEKETEQTEKRSFLPLVKNILFSSIILLFALCLYFISTFFFADDRIHEHHGITIESIRELSTIECRYHNVAIEQVDGGFLGIGYKELWMEYDTLVTAGIDLKKAYIKETVNEQGEIEIFLPDAEIISMKVDQSSMETIVCDSDIFTTITGEEQLAIVEAADAALLQDIPMKTYILQEAKDNAQKVLQAHVDSLNRLLGTDYTIKWLKSHPARDSYANNNSTKPAE